MQLFTYRSDTQTRTARLIGLLGVDLMRAAHAYLQSHSLSAGEGDKPLPSLVDLARLGPDELLLVKESTDWVIQTSQEFDTTPQKEKIVFEFNKMTLLAPIPRPGKVIGIGGNYPEKAQANKPEYPTVFLKPSSGVIGDQQPVVIPKNAKHVACEVELAVVIGKKARNISKKDAYSVIAGFTAANDIGDRALEKRTSQWTSGKMFDTFTPLGPVMVTPDEFDAACDKKLTACINDKPVQLGSLDQMFFNVSELISYLSTLTTLEPGDVILTGSPKTMNGEPNPVYKLKPGDTFEVGIEPFCSMCNTLIAESQAA